MLTFRFQFLKFAFFLTKFLLSVFKMKNSFLFFIHIIFKGFNMLLQK